MNNLFVAGLERLKKDRTFHSSIIFSILFATIIALDQFRKLSNNGMKLPLDPFIYAILIFIGIILAIFSSLFIGTEYSDGTIRNKIIAGKCRASIYISNLLIIIVTGIILTLVYMLSLKLIGYKVFNDFNNNLSETSIIMFNILFLIVSYSSVFTFLSLMFTNKTTAAITSILLSVLLIMISSNILINLEKEKYIENVVQIDGISVIEKNSNPGYLMGTKRKVYQFLSNVLPSGQSYQIISLNSNNINKLFIYSIGLSLTVNTIGLYVFYKKDLK